MLTNLCFAVTRGGKKCTNQLGRDCFFFFELTSETFFFSIPFTYTTRSVLIPPNGASQLYYRVLQVAGGTMLWAQINHSSPNENKL